MKTRTFIIRLAIVVLCVSIFPAGQFAIAQGKAQKPMRFAVINLQMILREAAATKTIRPQIEKLKKSYEVQFKKYEKELRATDQDLQKQRTILSPEAYASKRKAFKQRVNSLQRDVQTVQRLLDHAGRNALGKVHRAFHEIRVEIAKEKALDFIFPRSGLLHFNPKYDISGDVLKRLNKRLPSVTVKVPKQSASRKKKQ
ncbi:MAG: OmpH family outer membrane protein [Rhodospirillaceae bacterium]|jgi:outer membrane protein|nr:OmpH family outer membrane protein [Rhodospirillaceae bacterium]MBT5456142.1 OmpH family outer membrane protein [Rhodospirillaceae bacterium]